MRPLIQFKRTILLFFISLAPAWFAAAPTATAQAIFLDISTRSFVQTGDNVMIAGFILLTDNTPVLIRALGPTLGQPPFFVPNVLNDPTLELHDATTALIARNDDWRHTIIGGAIMSDQVAAIQSSLLAPPNGLESAMIVTLPAGNYTAIVRGFDNSVGVALVEVWR